MRLLTLQLAAGNLRLAEQSAEIADLYENAPCGYYSLDADGRIVRINRTALTWLGFDRHEVLGRKTLYDLLAAGSRQVLDAHSPRFTRGGAAPDLQLDLLRKDGSILPVVLSETAVYDAWGAFHPSRSTLFDDSERRRFEQALRDSEQRLHLLVDTVQTAVVVHAADSSIEFANPTAAELLGLIREQLLGRMAIDPGWSFVREDGSPMPVEEYPVSRVLQRGLALRDYVTGIHVPGSDAIRWVLVNAVPSIDENGKLRQVIVSFIDISERQRQKLRLEQLAATDTLTGLATRRHLLDMSKHELARARRSGQPLAVIMVDIDRFKSINDRFGHETGDVMLRRVGELLRAELRGSDVAARWGGEEFCLLLPDSNPDAAMETAERLRAAIEAAPMAAGDQSVLKVTASFGVAVSGPDDERLSRLVNAADQAMYQSKREGRNRVRLAAATPSPGAASPTPAGSTPAADR